VLLIALRQSLKQRARQGVDHQRGLPSFRKEPVDETKALEPAKLRVNRIDADSLAGRHDNRFRHGQFEEKSGAQQRRLFAVQRLPVDLQRELLKEVADVPSRRLSARVEALHFIQCGCSS
jgi:hypothetical protein